MANYEQIVYLPKPCKLRTNRTSPKYGKLRTNRTTLNIANYGQSVPSPKPCNTTAKSYHHLNMANDEQIVHHRNIANYQQIVRTSPTHGKLRMV